MAILILILVYAIVEATHDFHVIKGNSRKWHAWGMIQNALFFVALFWLADFRIVIASGVLFWQLHDSLLGYYLYKDIFYLGWKGMDGWIKKVFGGKSFLIIRIVTIGILLYDYLK